MDCNHSINYNILGRMKKAYQTQKSIIQVHLKKKRQLLDVATLTVVAEMESPAVLNSFPVDMSTLTLPWNLQHFVHSMLSSLDLCPRSLQELEEFVASSLLGMAEQVVRTRHNVLEAVLEIEELKAELWDEDEVVNHATADSTDMDSQSGGFGMTPASTSSIKEALRTEMVKGRDSKETCSICLDEFCDDMVVKLMPCSHIFHEACISRWLEYSNMCPLCRTRV